MNQPHKPLIRRTTAMTNAMVAAFNKAGIDTSGAVLPTKREPEWRVSRREPKGNRR